MEKTYQEQAISFALKAVISLGTVYVIIEKFIGHIDHLFHLESIWTALFIFFLIYFVTPVTVVSAYFFIKKDSVRLFENRTNIIIGWIAAVYVLAMALAFFVPITIFLAIGGGLMVFALCFLFWCMLYRKQRKHRNLSYQYLSVGYFVVIFAFTYLIRNDKHATDFECRYFSDEVKLFQAMNVVNDYQLSIANKFEPENPDTLKRDVLRSYFALSCKIEDKAKLAEATDEELLRLSRNRWGLYINLLSYKALLVLLPFIGMVVGFIFLFATSEERKEINTENITAVPPKVNYIPEKEFLRIVFAVLVTLTIPLLHPLTTIHATFQKPFGLNKGEKGEDGTDGKDGKGGRDGSDGETKKIHCYSL